MPVKNAGPFLAECLDSILNQSYKDWELIAVNDHSVDNSNEILKSYAEKDQRIKVFLNNGNGIIPSLRLAYKNSNGKFITRMDADDICEKDKLSNLISNLKCYGRGNIAIGQVEYFSDEKLGKGYIKYAEWLNKLTSSGNNFDEIYKECSIPSPTWMLYREDLEEIGAFNSDVYPEDYDLCFRMYSNGLNCIPSGRVLHLWRDHSERSSRNDPNYLDNHFSELKVNYFLKLDKKENQTLVLWGAGKRGKKIADLLINKNIDFQWICNNPNKIGKEINGKLLFSVNKLSSLKSAQIIVAVGNPEDQNEIKDELLNKGLQNMEDYYFFC